MTVSDKTPEFLKDALKFGINLGLDRMNKLDEFLGNPEANLKVIHIAGTNGKGSTSAFISSMLAASGKKVGIYTSPFLERFSERMRIIDGRSGLNQFISDDSYGEIDQDSLDKYSSIVEEASDKMVAMGYEHPTEFELVTAISYLWFNSQEVDVVILETGLGGRLDSTNVIANPLCTIITSIGFDHTERLGNTIEEIASEKAGILKSGSPCFICEPTEMLLNEELQKKVSDVFKNRADAVGSELISVSKNSAVPFYSDDGYMTFEYEGVTYKSGLLGDHQISNATVAIKAASYLGVDDESISYGISHTVWKGRCEIMSTNPLVIIDGGHNYQGALSLSRVVTKMLGGALINQEIRAVFGVMADKAVDDMLMVLHDSDIRFKEITAVKVNNPRSMSSSELYNKIDKVYNSTVEVYEDDDAVKGVLSAYKKSLEDGLPLLVSGSLYLLGQIRGELKRAISSQYDQ